jgi:cysteinyl-tRNA synthetase
MSAKHLGETFDIHGGGIDLVFPHHENEVAQSRCAHGTELMANIWMHNGFLQVEGEKMSKSLGNFVTPRELLREQAGEAIRLAMLMTHYRQPINWTAKGLAEARRALDHWYELTAAVEADGVEAQPDPEVVAALSDDLNTPKAISVLHELRTAVVHGDAEAARRLKASARLMGLLQLTSAEWAAWRPESAAEIDATQVEALIAARIEARGAKNWADADRIRDELVAMGVVLKDAKDPETGDLVTTWQVAR